MKHAATKVTLMGILILFTAFGYSWLTIVSDRTEYRASDDDGEVVQELIPSMNETGMGMMNYQDGTYTATVNYEIPYGFMEPMEVTLQFQDNIIKDVRTSFTTVNPVSEGYQQIFSGYVSREAVGRKIDDVELSRMGGASLTNQAFDKALTEIKAEAAGMPMMDSGGVMPMQPVDVSSSQNNQMVTFQMPSSPSVETSEFVINSVTEEIGLESSVYIVDHSYTVNPFLTEPMWTTVTVTNDVVTDTSVKFDSPDQISIMHQEFFVDQYRDEIIGQPIENVSLSHVSYASLTTKAFNDALEAVREKRALNDV